ncbi:19462_t:CDS:2, partial [Gigaspora margarita]
DPYNAGWYSESDDKFEMIKEKRIRNKEEIPKVNVEPENLVLDLIKNIYREILSRKELKRNKRPTYKLYQKSTKISHNNGTTRMGNLGQYYQDSSKVEKSKVIKEKDELRELLDAYYDLNDAVFGFNEEQENELEVLLKEVSTECKINVRNNKDKGVKVRMELDPFEEKKEEKAETVPTKYNLDNKAKTEGDRETFEERSVKEWCKDRYRRPLDGDDLDYVCNL